MSGGRCDGAELPPCPLWPLAPLVAASERMELGKAPWFRSLLRPPAGWGRVKLSGPEPALWSVLLSHRLGYAGWDTLIGIRWSAKCSAPPGLDIPQHQQLPTAAGGSGEAAEIQSRAAGAGSES